MTDPTTQTGPESAVGKISSDTSPILSVDPSMADTQSAVSLNPPDKNPPSAEARFSKPIGPWWRLLFFLMILSFGGGLVWTGRAIHQLDRALKEFQNQFIRAQQDQQDERELLNRGLRELQSKQQEQEERFNTIQDQQNGLAGLYHEISGQRDALLVAEVEQLVRLAQQQLQIANDSQGALAALQNADGRIAKLSRPALLPLRRALTKDLEKLQAVPYVDTVGIHLRLTNLAAQIDVLPTLAKSHSTVAPTPNAESITLNDLPSFWRRLWQQWRSDLAQFIKIERVERSVFPLLSPEQEFFLRENLKLKLTVARLALLNRDQAHFETSLQDAETWINRFFDTQQPKVQAEVLILQQLTKVQIAPELPDLSQTENAIQQFKAAPAVIGVGKNP